jgi:hypothetical protein
MLFNKIQIRIHIYPQKCLVYTGLQIGFFLYPINTSTLLKLILLIFKVSSINFQERHWKFCVGSLHYGVSPFQLSSGVLTLPELALKNQDQNRDTYLS